MKLTARQMFRIMFRIARLEHVRNQAFTGAERALDTFLDQHMPEWDWDEYQRAADVQHGVLWALHWTRCKPKEKLKMWQSERRYSWNLDGAGTVEHPGPMLPG